mmetsp:Transcript_932/g.1702  ORF Transcript_932/g.1702 Transcript_932/m.1702 type:complete len:210 (-) Transcript_932:300-929(-)
MWSRTGWCCFKGGTGSRYSTVRSWTWKGCPLTSISSTGGTKKRGMLHGRPYFETVADTRPLHNSTRYLYWTPAYDGGWLMDDDLKHQSSNAFLSSPSGRMAGTWAVAIGSSHWIDERSVSVKCATAQAGPQEQGAERTQEEMRERQEIQNSASVSSSTDSSPSIGKKHIDSMTLLFAIDTGTTTVSRITVDTKVTPGAVQIAPLKELSS